MIASFRHKGLEEIYVTGKTRRIGIEHIRKCVRILQLLELATQPEDMKLPGYRFHSLYGKPRPRHGKLPNHVRMVRRKRE